MSRPGRKDKSKNPSKDHYREQKQILRDRAIELDPLQSILKSALSGSFVLCSHLPHSDDTGGGYEFSAVASLRAQSLHFLTIFIRQYASYLVGRGVFSSIQEFDQYVDRGLS